MVAKTPIRATLNGSEVTGLAEYQSGEFIDLSHGGLGASLSIGTTGQVLKVNSGGTALEFGNVEAVINIDTANDLTGSTLVSSDQILLSDGGTEGRVTLSQLDTLFSGTTQTLTNKTFDANGTGNSISNIEVADFASGVVDTDLATVSASDDTLASAKAIKTYVDSQVTAQDLDLTTDSGTIAIDLDTETLTVSGGTGIDTSATGNAVTVAIDSSVVTDSSTHTLTNKTFDANGTGNSLSNVEVADFAGSAIVIESEGIGSNDNDTTIPTSAAVKDYVDNTVTAQDLDFQGDSGGALSIDLDSETLTIAGGTGINTSGATNTLTVGIDNTVVATLSDTQTLTNKTINLSSNTLTGTTAQFNTALSDGSFATLAGTETLTNKTLTSPVIAEITSGADIDLSATNDVNIPANVGLTFGDDGEKIEGDGTNLTISASNAFSINATNSIFLTSAQSTQFRKGSTNYLTISDSSSDAVITSAVQDKDIIFKGNDGGSTITALTLDMSEAGNATFNNNVTVGNDLTVTGNLIVSGTTTTVNTETINLADNTITLNSNETGTPSQDGGIEIERGTSTNKTLIWNETTDKWTVGSETFVAGTFEGALTGNVTGDVTGDLTGNVTGNLTGDVTGNADTATALETARTIAGQSFDGTANITIASTDLSNTSNITLNDATQTLTNKTLTSPVIATISNTGTLTLPTSTGTVALVSDIPTNNNQLTNGASYITASSTDTLTNKSGNISQWTNDAGYLTSFTETNDLTSSVTWANVPDANITESSVTQHQAALSVTESQISDLQSYITATSTDTLTNKTIDATSNTISNIGDSQLTTGIDAAKISSGTVSNTEFDYLNGVTSSIQTQIDNRATKGFAIAMAIAL